MKITSETTINKALGEFRLGIIKACVANSTTSEELNQLIQETCKELSNAYDLEQIRELESIVKIRNAYKLLGNDPNRYRPSADALLRRIVKGIGLYSINSVVDVLNLVSIQTGYSISGFDLNQIEGNIELGIGREGEPYQGIGRGELNIHKLPVLRDTIGAVGNPTSDSLRTMIQVDTTNILFVFYDFGKQHLLDETIINCEILLKHYCKAKESQVEVLEFPEKSVV